MDLKIKMQEAQFSERRLVRRESAPKPVEAEKWNAFSPAEKIQHLKTQIEAAKEHVREFRAQLCNRIGGDVSDSLVTAMPLDDISAALDQAENDEKLTLIRDEVDRIIALIEAEKKLIEAATESRYGLGEYGSGDGGALDEKQKEVLRIYMGMDLPVLFMGSTDGTSFSREKVMQKDLAWHSDQASALALLLKYVNKESGAELEAESSVLRSIERNKAEIEEYVGLSEGAPTVGDYQRFVSKNSKVLRAGGMFDLALKVLRARDAKRKYLDDAGAQLIPGKDILILKEGEASGAAGLRHRSSHLSLDSRSASVCRAIGVDPDTFEPVETAAQKRERIFDENRAKLAEAFNLPSTVQPNVSILLALANDPDSPSGFSYKCGEDGALCPIIDLDSRGTLKFAVGKKLDELEFRTVVSVESSSLFHEVLDVASARDRSEALAKAYDKMRTKFGKDSLQAVNEPKESTKLVLKWKDKKHLLDVKDERVTVLSDDKALATFTLSTMPQNLDDFMKKTTFEFAEPDLERGDFDVMRPDTWKRFDAIVHKRSGQIFVVDTAEAGSVSMFAAAFAPDPGYLHQFRRANKSEIAELKKFAKEVQKFERDHSGEPISSFSDELEKLMKATFAEKAGLDLDGVIDPNDEEIPETVKSTGDEELAKKAAEEAKEKALIDEARKVLTEEFRDKFAVWQVDRDGSKYIELRRGRQLFVKFRLGGDGKFNLISGPYYFKGGTVVDRPQDLVEKVKEFQLYLETWKGRGFEYDVDDLERFSGIKANIQVVKVEDQWTILNFDDRGVLKTIYAPVPRQTLGGKYRWDYKVYEASTLYYQGQFSGDELRVKGLDKVREILEKRGDIELPEKE